MLVSSKDDTHQPRDVDSFGPVYAGIYRFAIPAGATRGRMASVCFDSELYTEDFHVPLSRTTCTWRVLLEPLFETEDFYGPYQEDIHSASFSFLFVIPAEAIRGSRLDLRRHLCLRRPSRLPHRTPRRSP